jgi:hypothetical protein
MMAIGSRAEIGDGSTAMGVGTLVPMSMVEEPMTTDQPSSTARSDDIPVDPAAATVQIRKHDRISQPEFALRRRLAHAHGRRPIIADDGMIDVLSSAGFNLGS